MFAAPEEIQTEVFARLPEELDRSDRPSEWLRRKGRSSVAAFLEGPSFDRCGLLYTVDIAHGRIFRIDRQGRFTTVADYDGAPNGLKIHKDGRVFVADGFRGIVTVDPETGIVETVVGGPAEGNFKGLNDLVFASNGDLFFTDQGETGYHDPTGRLFCLRADGRLVEMLSNIPSPNGLVLNRSEDGLYLAVTRDNAVWRVPFRPDTLEAYKVGKFIQLSGSLGSGPDGLAVDEEDNLVVAHAGLGSVWVFSRIGEPLYRVRSCAGLLTTNIAYGGAERKSLFITESESNTVLVARLPVAGRAMYSHA